MRAPLLLAGCFLQVWAVVGTVLTVAARTQETRVQRRRQPLSTLTCVCIEDWEGSPEPKHDVHLKQPVGDHTEDEEKCRAAKEEPDRKDDIRICRYKETQKKKNIGAIVNHHNHIRFCIVCLCLWWQVFFHLYTHIFIPSGSRVKYALRFPLELYATQV